MIKKVIIFSLLFLSFSGYAQKDSNRFREPFVSINAGAGVPTNDFYLEDLAGFIGGGAYATNGYTLNISGDVPIAHSRWGITGFISHNVEPFNINQCFLDLCEKGNYDQLVSSSYSDFKETLLMGGVSFSAGEKSNFDFRLMAGDNICTLAGYSLKGTSTIIMSTRNYSTDITASMQTANYSAMAYDFGIDCRFLQRKHFIGLLSCDFMYSQTYVYTIYDDIYYEHYRINYNLLSLTVGIGYKF